MKIINKRTSIIVLAILFIIVLVLFVYNLSSISSSFRNFINSLSPYSPFPSEAERIEKFSSEEDFKTYLQKSQGLESYGGGLITTTENLAAPAGKGMGIGGGGAEAERVSTTNVQVFGIDEPDVVKTDGKEIYFSPGYEFAWRYSGASIPERMPEGKTFSVRAFPPDTMALDGKIEKSGNLLLSKNILVIFSGQSIYGYDVSDPKAPAKKWKMDLENNNYIAGARLYKEKIYLVVAGGINAGNPCPIKPLSVEGGSPLNVRCIDIYHPVVNVPVDVTYTAAVLDPGSGKIEKSTSFVGSSSSSVVYMSEQSLFITYSYGGNYVKFFADFFAGRCKDIIPDWVITRLNNLEGYDISDAAKMTEFGIIIQRYFGSLKEDERIKAENEITNRMADYYKDKKRNLEKTGIAKITLENLDLAAAGEVPGRPLNEFSLDEYKDYLRIATTVGGGFWGFGFIDTGETGNDVYILDKKMNMTGAVKDLGAGERIYSVRFLGDKGYVVTFKQIDPFFVLDLADPQNPAQKGELKIPGYSSYLHPISETRILGIGMEDFKLKLSLFNAASAENPVEISKYNLDDYWSEVSQTHHAFLLDSKHEIFFFPGSKGGYIFSYKNDQLKLERVVSGLTARRAIYLDDYLYIIGDNKIVVVNELNWENANELELE